MGEADDRRPLRVLIAEDEAVTALLLGKYVAELGHDVVASVDDAPAAITAAALHEPDLILMDIGLAAHTDGVDAAVQVRKLFDTPCIFVTGQPDALKRHRVTAAKPLGILVKPFTRLELQRELRRVTELLPEMLAAGPGGSGRPQGSAPAPG